MDRAISLRVDAESAARIEALALREDRKLTAMTRILLREALDARERKQSHVDRPVGSG